jgi:hypothetical protein
MKYFSLHVVKADEPARTIEGWASTFGNVDSDGDIIAPGAFRIEPREDAQDALAAPHRRDKGDGGDP